MNQQPTSSSWIIYGPGRAPGSEFTGILEEPVGLSPSTGPHFSGFKKVLNSLPPSVGCSNVGALSTHLAPKPQSQHLSLSSIDLGEKSFKPTSATTQCEEPGTNCFSFLSLTWSRRERRPMSRECLRPSAQHMVSPLGGKLHEGRVLGLLLPTIVCPAPTVCLARTRCSINTC